MDTHDEEFGPLIRKQIEADKKAKQQREKVESDDDICAFCGWKRKDHRDGFCYRYSDQDTDYFYNTNDRKFIMGKLEPEKTMEKNKIPRMKEGHWTEKVEPEKTDVPKESAIDHKANVFFTSELQRRWPSEEEWLPLWNKSLHDFVDRLKSYLESNTKEG